MTGTARRLAALGLLCVAPALLAQTIMPVEQEPVHTIVFENDVVRVIDAALPVGHATLYHTHVLDNVPVAVAGGLVATTLIGREPVESVVKVGEVSFAVGGYTHVVRNVGPTPLRFIDVELRTSAPAAPASPPTTTSPLAGHAAALSNARVHVHRVVVAPGRHLDAHQHPGPVLAVLVAGDAVLRAGVASPVAAGSFRWHGDGAISAVRNTGRVAYEVVEVEWIK
jgi:mannose-6-phosphate isomerase-like protein (cupin superfamily)